MPILVKCSMPSNVYQPTCLQLDTIYVFDRPLNKCIVPVSNPSPALLHYMFVDCVLKCPYFKCTKRYISIVCVLYFQNIHISCAPRSVFFYIFVIYHQKWQLCQPMNSIPPKIYFKIGHQCQCL